MKVTCVLVVSALSVVAFASPAIAQSTSRVRALDVLAQEALERGRSESPRFRGLLAELEASDLIVHLVTSFTLPSRTIGTTRLSSAGPGHRYVRIAVRAELSPEERAATLGHELQHACEIARSPARDARSIRALYEAIGRRVSDWREAYETPEAIEVGAQVWSDIHHSPRRSAIGSQEQ